MDDKPYFSENPEAAKKAEAKKVNRERAAVGTLAAAVIVLVLLGAWWMSPRTNTPTLSGRAPLAIAPVPGSTTPTATASPPTVTPPPTMSDVELKRLENELKELTARLDAQEKVATDIQKRDQERAESFKALQEYVSKLKAAPIVPSGGAKPTVGTQKPTTPKPKEDNRTVIRLPGGKVRLVSDPGYPQRLAAELKALKERTKPRP